MYSKSGTSKTAASYYQKLGSRLGYLLVMRRSQHFGYYDELNSTEELVQDNYHDKFIKLLDLHQGMKVLDAGCGQGVVATEVAKSNKVEVVGITITPHEVKSATRRARRAGVESSMSFYVQDYANTTFDNNSFDRVYTTESLSRARDVKQVLSEFYRILKPGGMLICAEYEMDHENFDNDTRRLAKPLSGIVKKLRPEDRFVNVTAASMHSDGVENRVFAYKVYVCKK